MTKNGRWGFRQVFLAGESYGTTRAAALSNYLQERVGVKGVSGVVLISTVLNFSVLMPGENNDVPFALYLPSYAAVGWYHKKAGVGKPLEAWLQRMRKIMRPTTTHGGLGQGGEFKCRRSGESGGAGGGADGTEQGVCAGVGFANTAGAV